MEEERLLWIRPDGMDYDISATGHFDSILPRSMKWGDDAGDEQDSYINLCNLTM